MKENESCWGSNKWVYLCRFSNNPRWSFDLLHSIIASRLIVYAAIITAHCYFSTQSSTQLTVFRKGDAIKCLTASIFLILDSSDAIRVDPQPRGFALYGSCFTIASLSLLEEIGGIGVSLLSIQITALHLCIYISSNLWGIMVHGYLY